MGVVGYRRYPPWADPIAEAMEAAVDHAFAEPAALAHAISKLRYVRGAGRDLFEALWRAAFPADFPDPDDGTSEPEPPYCQWRAVCQPPRVWLTADLRDRLEAAIAEQAAEAEAERRTP